MKGPAEVQKARLDYKLAELVGGEHDFSGYDPSDNMEHELMVVQLEELRLTLHAMFEAGWQRHTSDWDFEIQFHTRSGKSYRSYNYEWRLEFEESFEKALEGSKLWTACVDHSHVRALIVEDDIPYEESITHKIPLEDLKSIYIERA